MSTKKRKHEKGIRAFARRVWDHKLTWVLIGFFVGYFLEFYLNPIIYPALSEKPQLNVQVFHSNAPYTSGETVYNITWQSSYEEYIVMIQQDMTKAKSTPIVDVHIAFDFNCSVVTTHEEEIVEASEPSIRIPFVTTIGTSEIRSLQVIFEVGELRPGGICSFSVIIDPNFQGSTYRSEIIGENTFSGHYYYDAKGIVVEETVNGDVPVN